MNDEFVNQSIKRWLVFSFFQGICEGREVQRWSLKSVEGKAWRNIALQRVVVFLTSPLQTNQNASVLIDPCSFLLDHIVWSKLLPCHLQVSSNGGFAIPKPILD
jgi:hypothetical protein